MSVKDSSFILNLRDSYRIHKSFQETFPNRGIPNPYQYDQSLTVSENLDALALNLLDDVSSTCIFYSYRPIIIELVTRIVTNTNIENEYKRLKNATSSLPGCFILNSLAKIFTSTKEISILLEYFLEKSQMFTRINESIDTLDQDVLQLVLLSFYRLITVDRQKFYRFVFPDTLHTIIQSSKSTNINKQLSIMILSIYLYLSEETKIEMIKNHVDSDNLLGYFEGDQNINYKFLGILEAKRLSNLSNMKSLQISEEFNEFCIRISNKDISKGVSIVCDVMLTNLSSLESQDSTKESTETNFVDIDKSVTVLKDLATCIQNSQPVMLIGKAGSGKTFLIDELSRFIGMDSNNIIKIHLNQQTDSKLLLGTYSSGNKPGSFDWKSGVLTTAVKEGRWVLVEDIDKAPNEVLSILLSLLENRELTIPSRGEVIKAANGFQLISTIRSSNDDSKKLLIPDMIGLRLWNKVQLQELDFDDLQVILNHKFPLLKRFSKLFINCFFNVKKMYAERRFISMNKGSQPRVISVRDLMKFCNRCSYLLQNNGVKSIDDFISDEIYDLIFQEAVDCFTSSVVEIEPIHALTLEIGNSLEISTSRINLHLTRHVPVLQETNSTLSVGRALLNKQITIGISSNSKKVAPANSTSFARTNHSLRLMEKVGVGIAMCEPLLLVGETGTGKTTIVQQLAKLLNKKLTVINVSQQTEVGDLLGGFKPINAKTISLPIQEDFEDLFNRSFSIKKNAQFLKLLAKCFNKNQWKNVIRLWKEAHKMAKTTFEKKEEEVAKDDEEGAKKKRKLNREEKSEIMKEWNAIQDRVLEFEKQVVSIENSFVFKFVEGSVVKAVRNGEWLLLDEVNLAAPETLDSISDLLTENIAQRNVLLSEKGDIESIKAHPDFRIFGCMNPATDVGKKDLPVGIRSRFSEIYVHSPDGDLSDLLMIIDKYIGKYAITDEWIGNDIAELYMEAKRLSDSNQIVDGANQKPHFSIRTLTRTLIYSRDIISIYGLRRALYEGFCMSFLTLLDGKSESVLKPVIEKFTIDRLKNARAVISQTPPNPSDASNPNEYVNFKHYWLRHGPEEVQPQPNYILTPFVEKNMLNLVRATSGRRFPVLIQGPTSSGKTSMINYLAKITGHNFVRINNHEHTDLQEYLGTYVSDDTGKLVFKEGILVEALKKGHWIVLDELNLAPTDVLEALNRLLDDNRELFIPETQEVVHPHPDFMLFATQNPPGLYGGRKVLSKAFRNRFLELHFDDIPQDELETILKDRCKIPESYAKKIVQVYKELSIQRQSTRLFEQKNSFATLRDLFRWALREAVGYEQLAANGYMLLAERVRRPEEKVVVKEVLEKVMRVKLDMDAYYNSLEIPELLQLESPVVWTKAMRRLAVLVTTSMQYNEPLLLVGETGCGKTTVCQLIAHFFNKELVIVNAHQNTETGDLLGSQRPVRNRAELQTSYLTAVKYALDKVEASYESSATIDELVPLYHSIQSDERITDEEKAEIEKLRVGANALFEWSDGPLIKSLKSGCFFLLDEISLADDSVLERLNSVLEPERSLLLAEKGTVDSFITAEDGFQFLATMNPGGDYGKKELSPALRNRFTEIWVPSMEDFEDVEQIVTSKLSSSVKYLSKSIILFSEWFAKRVSGGSANNGSISLRDILAWVSFINSATNNGLPAEIALLHGACMVFIDALGTNNTAFLAEKKTQLEEMRLEFVNKLAEVSKMDLLSIFQNKPVAFLDEKTLHCGYFQIERKEDAPSTASFNLQAPTTAANAMRVIRAMQVHKPILLEGSPGVGKTSLISALAQATGNNLTRINLSEQTDLIDLFGSDSPAEGGEAGEFVWRDAPFLRAMQKGEWVLLDEMNLASQSVLEGLNACLDHRGEAYIPELDRSFTSHPDFLVFAAQNPQYQGGGRKGLPKSFVNRFSVVYVNMLEEQDLQMIAQHIYPSLDSSISNKMISFMSKLEEEVVVKRDWGSSGGPWEFNLRDTLRWLSLLDTRSLSYSVSPSDFFEMVILQRFRTVDDRVKATELFESFFGNIPRRDPYYMLGVDFVQCKQEILPRNRYIQYTSNHHLVSLQSNWNELETMFRCINHAWPMILVGPSNSGKTELIRFTASVVGAKLYEFSMNSDIDSMDILGGYEQSDVSRDLSEASNELVELLLETVAINLRSNRSVVSTLQHVLSMCRYLMEERLTVERFSKLYSDFTVLKELIHDSDKFGDLSIKLDGIKEKLDNPASVKFQWFDGLLVQAVEKGHWLILDNANLCSPSVLDRLNSLLEINGSLIINECTQADGTARVVTPHPNFRLFLTSDPKYGELSRAMRNRGVEIYLNPIQEKTTTFDAKLIGDASTEPAPLSSFVSSYNSDDRSLSLLFDSVEATVNKGQQQYGNSDFSLVTFKSSGEIAKLVSEIIKSSDFDSKLVPVLEKMVLRLNYIESLSFTDKLYSSYATVEDISERVTARDLNFTQSQIIHPLLNSYIVESLSSSNELIGSSETTYFFEVICFIVDADIFMTSLRNRVESIKVSDMSYLERSAASYLGRNVKKETRLKVYTFVNSIYSFIKKLAQNAVTEGYLWKQEHYFSNLFDLCVLWNNLVDQSKTQNESKLRVYQDQVREWIKLTEDTYPAQIMTEIEQAVESFFEKLDLTRGQSMSIIWESFRSIYPSTERGWNEYEKLVALANEFDEVAKLQFHESFDIVNEMRSVILELFKDCARNTEGDDFESMYSTLSQKIQELNQISSKFLDRRDNKLRKEYSSLLNFTDLHHMVNGEVIPMTDENKILFLQADRTTHSMSRSLQQSMFIPYPRIFNNLWENNDNHFISHVNGLLDDSLFRSLTQQVLQFKYTAGDRINEHISDVNSLASLMISNSTAITTDHLNSFKTVLLNWIVETMTVHLESTNSSLDFELLEQVHNLKSGPLSSISLLKFLESVSKTSLEHLSNVINTYFAPALLLLSKESNKMNLGRAFILSGCGFVQLYVPDSSYDPAISEHILYDNFTKLSHLIESITESWKTTRVIIAGDNNIEVDLLLPGIGSGKGPSKPRVFRSETSIDSLFDEWFSFIDSSFDTRHIETLVTASNEFTDKSGAIFENFQQNSSQFIYRLQNKYSRYADLNDIFIGYIYAVKVGSDLLRSSSKDVVSSSDSLIWPLNLSTVSNFDAVETIFANLRNILKSVSIDSFDVERIYVYFMELIPFQKKLSSKLKSSLEEKFTETIMALYYRWSLRRLKQEELESTQQGVFKFSDPQMDAEKDFKMLFPDAEDVIEVSASENTKITNVADDLYYDIAERYVAALLPEETGDDVQSLVNSGTEIISSLSKLYNVDSCGSNNSSVLASLILQLNKATHAFTDSQDSKSVDFYKGYSSYETRKAGIVINKLRGAAHKLLEQWPEHATLQHLFRNSTEFLEYPSTTPVYRLLTKVEQLYTYLGEWEKYAHSGVSLKDHVESLSSLIVSWRKLELVSWRQVFVNEENNLKTSMGKWWFHLFESIIVPATNGELEEEENQVKVLSAINIFLSQTTQGEFGYRLKLIKAFVKHVELLAPDSLVSDSLLNIVTFYGQFTSTINENIATNKKQLEKQLNEIILLASWKDINIDSLKQSSRRSHHNLYKIIRKYRDVLNQSITGMIETGISSGSKVSITNKKFNRVSVSLNDKYDQVLTICSNVSTWNERPKRLQDLSLVHKNMNIYYKGLEAESVPSIYEFAKDIVERADALRKETPQVATEENKKLCASLKTEKRKLLSDSISELKRMGLRLHTTSDVKNVLTSVTTVLATSKSLSETSLSKIDGYFFRLLDLLPRLRASINSLNEEVPVPDAQKSLASAENLIFNLVARRETLVKVEKLHSSLEKRIAAFEPVQSLDITILKASMVEDAKSTREMLLSLASNLPSILQFAIDALHASGEFSRKPIDATLFGDAQVYFKTLNVSKNELFTIENVKEMNKVGFYISQFIDKLSSWKNTNKTVGFIADFVIDWMNSQKFDFNVYSNTSRESIGNVEIVEESLRDVSTSILVAVQKVFKIKEDLGSLDEETDNWFLLSQRKLQKYADALYPLRIESQLKTCFDAIESVEFDSATSTVVTALISHALPLLKHYYNIVSLILENLSSNYVETSHATYILCTLLYKIATDGFCSPEPPSEQKESDNLQDGTGLGEGDGATNNSKDVEDDEDLSEQAQQPNKEDRDKDDQDENDDAVDIEGDMAGDLEDAPPEDNESGEEEDKEEEEELDEEVDDLDDMDPNAVDEKMWDEEAKEDTKEKESDEMPNDSKESNEMEGVEDQEEDDDSKKNNKEDDSKPPEDSKDEDDKNENDENAEDEDDVAEQDDEVRNDEDQQADADIPEAEVLDLPEDINLDSDKEGSDEEDEAEDGGFDDKMDDNDDMQDDENVDEDADMNDVDMDKKPEEEEAEENEDGEDESDEKAEGEANDSDTNEEENENEGDDGFEDGKDNDAEGDENEELMDVDQENEEEKPKEESKEGEEEEDSNNVEGVDGLEDGANDDVDADAAVQQQGGAESEGADADIKEEQDNIGASGGASNFQDQQEQQEKEEDESNNDSSREKAKESLKELGDSMKEFYRRRQEIKEATDDDMVDQKSNERPDEFQHLDGENTNEDTQALGAANKDQIQSIDDDMAIDDEEEEVKQEEEEEERPDLKQEEAAQDRKEDTEVQDALEEDGDANGQTKTAMIGERKRDLDALDEFSEKMEIDESEEDASDEEIDQYLNQLGLADNDDLRPYTEAHELWSKSDMATQELTAGLCEQLRLILEPTLATKLRGDYKTGKRLNMKRIIPYIASQFRKDKIWMRRTKPSKRQYQIMIAVDDSKSMEQGNAVEIAFQSIALVSKALTQLESGQLSVVKFGEKTKVVHPFERPFNSECGVRIFQSFKFDETKTDVERLVSSSLKLFSDARTMGDSDLWQLQIILSDGVCGDHATIQRLVRQAREEKVMLVFVIIDGVNNKESILNMTQANFIKDANGNSKLQLDRYLDTFPFEFYVVVHNIAELPEMLALILRQYFSELASN